MVRYYVDVSDLDEELDRLERGPGAADLLRLEAVLTQLFQTTQQAVHVRTGSLRGSGRVNSRFRQGVWHGEIKYGGPAPGEVHDPVRYARLEQRRGGLHDFLLPIADADEGYVRAMIAYLRGSG